MESDPFLADHFASCSQLCDQLAIGVLVVDDWQEVRMVNSVCERLLGKPRSQMVGLHLDKLLPGHPVGLDLLDRARRLNMPCRMRQVRWQPTLDISLTVSLTAVPLVDRHGQTKGGLLQIEELGSLERLEEGQRLNDTLDSLGDMALAVAHEVKNPLAGIRGAAQLLESEVYSQSAKEYVSLIQSEVDRIIRLLDNLLGVVDNQPNFLEELNIHEVLEHVIKLGFTDQHKPKRDFDPSLPPVRGDRDQLIQLFLNLVHNATAAATVMGQVILRSRMATQVRLEGGRRVHQLLIEVEDNGPGIPPEIGRRIFNPFFSTKPEGTGLGLSISQRIVHDHAGLMEYVSLPGRTIFRVFLPVPS
ncbi:MAG: ATP-binding protein [Magnetococcus sp. DMHC-6]